MQWSRPRVPLEATPGNQLRDCRAVPPRQVRDELVVMADDHLRGGMAQHPGDPAGVLAAGERQGREGAPGLVERPDPERGPAERGPPDALAEVGGA